MANVAANGVTRLASIYRRALFEDIIPFWERHSIDREHGGYFTCLDRRGNIYDTDKYVWLQARQVWTFSTFYLAVEPKPKWLEIARLGADFLKKHGRDSEGHWCLALTKEGKPLAPSDFFAGCFAALGFSAYARASGDDEARSVALHTFENLLRTRGAGREQGEAAFLSARPMKPLAVPMILVSLADEVGWILGEEKTSEVLNDCTTEILEQFLNPELGVPHEYVHATEGLVDCIDGRLICPGHVLEAMWFLMQAAERLEDRGIAMKAAEIALRAVELGWDQDRGGILCFLDAGGKPLDRLEWDQKVWWVHCEALVALIMAYRLTRAPEALKWFERIHDYTWGHFPDPIFGEWYPYLNRNGEVLLDFKGGKWKGCFHLPRALLFCLRELEKISEKGNGSAPD